MFKTLETIAKAFNSASLNYVIGGSLVLYYNGLTKEVHDIDIIVNPKDFYIAHSILTYLGEEIPTQKSDIFISGKFSKFIINQQKIDMFSDFKIKHEEGIYKYHFDESPVVKFVRIGDEKLPIGALEDWLVMYALMPNRYGKVSIISKFFEVNSFNQILLERSLNQPLPKTVREIIDEILKK